MYALVRTFLSAMPLLADLVFLRKNQTHTVPFLFIGLDVSSYSSFLSTIRSLFYLQFCSPGEEDIDLPSVRRNRTGDD